jgi:Cytochrome P450
VHVVGQAATAPGRTVWPGRSAVLRSPPAVVGYWRPPARELTAASRPAGSAHGQPGHRPLPDPERFDVTRLPNPHLSFGFGPRFCLGAPLARLELQALFAALLHRPDLRLAVPPDELRPRRDILTGGLQTLPVTWST